MVFVPAEVLELLAKRGRERMNTIRKGALKDVKLPLPPGNVVMSSIPPYDRRAASPYQRGYIAGYRAGTLKAIEVVERMAAEDKAKRGE